MKIVINNCYGGFGLSPIGVKRYFELKGKQSYFYVLTDGIFERIDNIEDVDDFWFHCTTYDQGQVLSDHPKNEFLNEDVQRNDPALVQTVEELGDKASSRFSKLVVKEIENGRWFKINDYDGIETIQYRDIDDDWMLAQ